MITATTNIPEHLFGSMAGFIDTHPEWNQDRVMTAALSLFLMQNGTSDQTVSRTYFDTLTTPAVSDNLVDDPRIAVLLLPPALSEEVQT